MYLIASDLVEKEATESWDFPVYFWSLLGFQFGGNEDHFFFYR